MLSLLAVLFYILIFVAIYYYYLVVWYKNKAKTVTLPPGPRGIPFLGNLPQIAKDAPLKFSQWAKEYGKLYTIHFGNKPALVVNDAALMKQIFGLSAATGKFISDLFDVSYRGPYGVVNSEGPTWSEQRAFFMKNFRDAGFNRRAQMEPIILEEIEDLSDWISTQMAVQGTMHLSQRLKMTSGNIMWSVAVGEKQKTIIPELIGEWIICLNRAANSGLGFFSWIRHIAPKLTGYTDLVQISGRIHEFVQKYFDDPLRNEGHCEDMISAYINHVKGTTDKQSSFYGQEGLNHSLSSVVGLLIGGTETVATIMNWLIFYLAVNPDVQSKMQREMCEVIGENRDPSVEDRKRMPYTQAVIEETLRMSCMGPVGVIQVLLEDVSFLEYRLPKGLLLVANIYHVHNDPKVWGDPENFRPERFLETKRDSNDGDNYYSMKANLKENMLVTVGYPYIYMDEFLTSLSTCRTCNFMKWGPGRRTCPGDLLARDIIFLAATKLLKRFRFSPERGRSREEYLKPTFGYILVPKNIGVLAHDRREDEK